MFRGASRHMEIAVKNILVFGATGPQGRPVADKLVAEGYEVRALVRDPAKAQDLAAAGVEIVVGDMTDSASVSAAMHGQDGVFLLVSFITGRFEQAKTVIDQAVGHGIRKIVWNATGPIVPVATGNPSIDIRRDILAALEKSGIPFVALQPTVYMENFLLPFVAGEVANKDMLAYPMPEAVQCQWISHLDAASFAVAAFRRESRENLVLEISGPEKLTGPEIAERFSKALGRPIGFRPMPPREFGASLPYGGNGDLVAGYYEQVFADPSMMTTNVDYRRAIDLLPIAPTSVEDFARIYASQFSRS
jgi:NAD(P)H dehydrogenase (quinone)